MRLPTRISTPPACLLLRYSAEPTDDELLLAYDHDLDVNVLASPSHNLIAVESLGPIPTSTITKATKDPADQD